MVVVCEGHCGRDSHYLATCSPSSSGTGGIFLSAYEICICTRSRGGMNMPSPNAAPLTLYPAVVLPAVATATDADVAVYVVPFDCTVTAVTYTPNATITGADTNSRTLNLRNKGQSGVGSTVVASKAFTAGVNATGYDETTITLSGTAANLDLAAGDVLALNSDSIGTGLADPGGLLRVTVARR